MNETMDTLIGMGLLTTIGGPVTLGLCVANWFGFTRINWYFLAPLISAYLTLGTYIGVYGVHLSKSMVGTIVFSIVSSFISSIIVCRITHKNYVWTFTLFRYIDIKAYLDIFMGFIIVIGLGTFNVYSTYNSLYCNLRCMNFHFIVGFREYSGVLLYPITLYCTFAVFFYLVMIVAKRKER